MDVTTYLISIGITIKKYRIANGLSQEELSYKIGCDKNTIGNIERGDTDAGISNILKICLALNISFVQLAKEANSSCSSEFAVASDRSILRLFQYCKRLTPEEISSLIYTASLFCKRKGKS